MADVPAKDLRTLAAVMRDLVPTISVVTQGRALPTGHGDGVLAIEQPT